MQIVRQKSPNRNAGRQGNTPDIIVCHQTGGGFSSALRTVMNAANPVSYHFVVSGSGKITQTVEISDTAWANGTTNAGDARDNQFSTLPAVRERRRNANLYTISIGFADTVSGELAPPQLRAAVWLIGHICEEVRRLFDVEIHATRSHIVGHHEITPRTRPNCPGPRFPFAEILRALREEHEMRYYTIRDMPDWAQPPIRQLVLAGVLAGTGSVALAPGGANADAVTLDMPETMMRTLLVVRNMFERAGLGEALAVDSSEK